MIAQLKKENNTESKIDPQKVTTSAIGTQEIAINQQKPQVNNQKAQAFEIFKRGYPSGDWIDNQKGILKDKYAQAKFLGESANELRIKISIIF
jgi:hypothetical protein